MHCHYVFIIMLSLDAVCCAVDAVESVFSVFVAFCRFILENFVADLKGVRRQMAALLEHSGRIYIIGYIDIIAARNFAFVFAGI